MRVKYEEMVSEFKRVLEKYGFDGKRAEEAAEIFAQNSLAGVYSHGLNRFPRVVRMLEKSEGDQHEHPGGMHLRFGAFERWDGHRGFGPLNARQAMKRAVELAKRIWDRHCGSGQQQPLDAGRYVSMAGPMKAVSEYPGPIPVPICRPGEEKTASWAIIR